MRNTTINIYEYYVTLLKKIEKKKPCRGNWNKLKEFVHSGDLHGANSILLYH